MLIDLPKRNFQRLLSLNKPTTTTTKTTTNSSSKCLVVCRFTSPVTTLVQEETPEVRRPEMPVDASRAASLLTKVCQNPQQVQIRKTRKISHETGLSISSKPLYFILHCGLAA